MPHLQFEINKKVEDSKKVEFSKAVRETFSLAMDTGTEHIAISIREYDSNNLSLGRVEHGGDVCLMSLDIREGRTIEQRRDLALKYMDLVNSYFEIDLKNQYITFTEHKGEDFHLSEKYLSAWESGEDPLG